MAEQALASLHSDAAGHGRKADRFMVNRASRILSVNPALAGVSIRITRPGGNSHRVGEPSPC